MNLFSFLVNWQLRCGVSWVSLWLLISAPLLAQVVPTANQNYVVEQSPRTAQTTVTLSSGYMSVPATVSYLDGLGRPTQTIQVKGAGDNALSPNDIVTSATTYDAYGRADQTFLPTPSSVGGGGIQLQTTVQASSQAFYSDLNPYSQTVYEASPLNRPSQQWGPGQNWRSAGRSQQIRYGVAGNGTTSNVIRFKVNLFSNVIYGHVENDGTNWEYFGPNDIATRTLTDEQNNQTIEYTDLQGRTIRRDVLLGGGQTQTTVYVYDSYERLAAVIPPKLYDWFSSNSGREMYFYGLNTGSNVNVSGSPTGDVNTPNPQFKDNCYVYKYDARGRQISKHIPSAGWTELVYDFQDRLVMSQDQQDKTDGMWRYTRYDGLSRVTETGRMSQGGTAEDIRTLFAGSTITNENFPSSITPQAFDHLTENYYDTYNDPDFSFNSSGAFVSTPWSSNNATGLLTYTGVRTLGNEAFGGWQKSAFWYDDKGRVVQQQSQNHLGGVDRIDMNYQFSGELLQSVLRHQKVSGGTATTVVTTYNYDHMGRRTGLTYQYGGDAAKPLAVYNYDAIGRLVQKGIAPSSIGQTNSITRSSTPGNPTVDVATQYVLITDGTFSVNNAGNPNGLYEARIGISGLQVLDYRYHIRGWLRGINVDVNGQPTPNTSRSDVFSFGLDYETAGYYDGNIGRQRWIKSNPSSPSNQLRQYTYSYDGASRLTSASYSGASGEDYSLSNMSYDKNGNILSLNRAGIDQLTYSYGAGNSLTAVSDASSGSGGFTDGNASGVDYEYYPDGSLKVDRNRGITEIQYNPLKLPRKISFGSGTTVTKTVSYTYTASGQKLRMSTSTGEVRDYIGPFQYLNSAPFEVTHEEGRVLPGSTNGYEYFLRDHLGNVRAVVANVNGAFVTQMVDYDPWGLELSGLGSGLSSNRAKFNGKETLAELGSGMLDFGARGYDATIGRWGVVDPLAEVSRRFSPFVYGNDNPVRMIDPDGMETQEYQRSNRDDFGNVTFNGAALPGEGGYISGGTGPGKGKNDKTSSTATVSVDKQNDANFKEQTKDLGSDLADNLITIGKILLGIPEQSDPNVQVAAVPMPFFMGGGGSSIPKISTLIEANAGRQLASMEAATQGAHFLSRHGAGTTLAQQEIRALTGLTPDGISRRAVDASRFLSNQMQLQAAQRAQTIFNQTGQSVVNFNMGFIVGEGYLKGGSAVIQSTNVQAIFKGGNLYTMFPKLR
ncbi:DUF6443 domain-containing protein [Spirosoma litoris]